MTEGSYPIVIDGAHVGTLQVTRCGALTEFSARCRMLEGIVRISVYGADKEGCLGVLAPEGEGLALCRRLSRAAMREFPEEIESVERAGQLAQRTAAIAALAREEAEAAAQLAPPEMPENADDLLWYATPDGALLSFDGQTNFVALPEGDARIPRTRTGEVRHIEGRPYFVYAARESETIGQLRPPV